jgi:hypothetical protein
LSKNPASFATWITVDEPGLVEMYEVLSFSATASVATEAIAMTTVNALTIHFIGKPPDNAGQDHISL